MMKQCGIVILLSIFGIASSVLAEPKCESCEEVMELITHSWEWTESIVDGEVMRPSDPDQDEWQYAFYADHTMRIFRDEVEVPEYHIPFTCTMYSEPVIAYGATSYVVDELTENDLELRATSDQGIHRYVRRDDMVANQETTWGGVKSLFR